MNTRYLKVVRDFTADYTKNLMLVLAIAIGVFGTGAILGGYSVVKREMTDNYRGTVPASATIQLEDSISMELLERVGKLPGVEKAERHATVTARMKIGDQWHPLLLFVVDDFAGKRTNKVTRISGATEPPLGTMLAERTAYVVMKATEGDEILIKTPDSQPKRIKLSGTVHDPGLAPAWQEEAGYGYITLSTLHWLGEPQGFDQLRILVSEQQDSKEHIVEKAAFVADWLRNNGQSIHEIQIPPPGKHPHQSQMNAVMSIFIVFGFMVLLLGSILVSTSIATLMTRQVRQIGIMKAIGANSSQIMRLYLFMMFIICVIALSIAVPLSRLAAAGFYQQIAMLLNLEINNSTIPYQVLLVQVASGVFIPLAVAVFPVVRGSLVSVRTAMDSYGVSQKNWRTGVLVLKLSRLAVFNETFLLAVRNLFRQRSRLALILGLLAAGGAIFMTALNVSEAWEKNLSRIYTQRLHDLEVRLDKATPEASVLNALKNVPGVSRVEGWGQSATSLVRDNTYEITNTYPDKGHGSFTIQALPVPTRLLNPSVVEGQWLHGAEGNEVVLNQLARALAPGIKYGDRIVLSLEGKPTEWKVIGFTEDVGTPATAYVSIDAFRKQLNTRDKINVLRIAYADRSEENAAHKNQEVERALGREGISVSAAVPVWLLHNAIAAHMEVLVNSLLAMAVLMGCVGILGLMSVMSMNVMERTREIGVMRAIGATPGKIRSLVVWEGFIAGMFSIVIAFIFSLFISVYLGKFIGNMAFRTPLSLALSAVAIIVWVLIVIAGSYFATLYPARRASRITTREALAYE